MDTLSRSLLLLSAFTLLLVGSVQAQPRKRDRTPRSGGDSIVAIVNGAGIPWAMYNDLVADQQNYQRQELGREAEVDPSTRDQLLVRLIEEELMRQEAARRGIVVSEAAATSVLLASPPDFISRNFVDRNGVFQREIFRQAVLNPESIANFVQVSGKSREQIITSWKNDVDKLIRYIQNEEIRQRLSDSLVKAKPLLPAAIRARYMAERTRFDGSFIRILHSTIPDSLVPIGNDEALRWYETHLDDYRFPAQRELSTLILPVNPLSSDSAAQRDRLEQIRSLLASTPVEQRPAAVERIARTLVAGRFPNEPIGLDRIPIGVRKQVAESHKGDVLGPFPTSEEGDLSFFYVRGIESGGDTVVRARHILLKVEGVEENADSVMRVFADTLRSHLTTEAAFEEAARTYSADAREEGGDLGYLGRGIAVREFDSVIFAGPKGVALGPVRTRFGYHLVWIIDRSATSYRLQELRVPLVRIGDAAKKRVMADAQSYAAALSTGSPSADSIYRELRGRYRDAVADTSILGRLDLYGDGITANQFAYTADRNDVAVIELGGNRVMVAQRLRSWKASLATFEAVKINFVIPQARRERQLAMLRDVAKHVGDTMTADMALGLIRLRAPLAEAFMVRNQPMTQPPDEELSILDTLFERMGDSSVSGPVQGKHGYYFLRIVHKSYAPTERDWVGDREAFTADYTARYRKSFLDELLARLRRDAVVEDRRPFTGIIYKAATPK